MYSVDELAKYIALEDITWGNCYENIKKMLFRIKKRKNSILYTNLVIRF